MEQPGAAPVLPHQPARRSGIASGTRPRRGAARAWGPPASHGGGPGADPGDRRSLPSCGPARPSARPSRRTLDAGEPGPPGRPLRLVGLAGRLRRRPRPSGPARPRHAWDEGLAVAHGHLIASGRSLVDRRGDRRPPLYEPPRPTRAGATLSPHRWPLAAKALTTRADGGPAASWRALPRWPSRRAGLGPRLAPAGPPPPTPARRRQPGTLRRSLGRPGHRRRDAPDQPRGAGDLPRGRRPAARGRGAR
jgi:hypothetical protein